MIVLASWNYFSRQMCCFPARTRSQANGPMAQWPNGYVFGMTRYPSSLGILRQQAASQPFPVPYCLDLLWQRTTTSCVLVLGKKIPRGNKWLHVVTCGLSRIPHMGLLQWSYHITPIWANYSNLVVLPHWNHGLDLRNHPNSWPNISS